MCRPPVDPATRNRRRLPKGSAVQHSIGTGTQRLAAKARNPLPPTLLFSSGKRETNGKSCFFGTGGIVLGAVRRDRRDPDGQRLGPVRGVVLSGCDRAVVCSRLAGAAPARQRIEKSPIVELVITDSIALNGKKSGKIKVLSVAPLLGEAIRRIHEEKTVSGLFV